MRDGDLRNIVGVVQSVSATTGSVVVLPTNTDELLKGAKFKDGLAFESNQLQKWFKMGDHVKVRHLHTCPSLASPLTTSLSPHLSHHTSLSPSLAFSRLLSPSLTTPRVRDHVQVTGGSSHVGETGLVVRVGRGDAAAAASSTAPAGRELNHLYIFSDLTQAEIVVPAAHVTECNDVSSGLETLGQYALHDIVTVDRTSAAVVIKVEHSSFKLLTTSNEVVSMPLSQMGRKKTSKGVVALDFDGTRIEVNSPVQARRQPHRTYTHARARARTRAHTTHTHTHTHTLLLAASSLALLLGHCLTPHPA